MFRCCDLFLLHNLCICRRRNKKKIISPTEAKCVQAPPPYSASQFEQKNNQKCVFFLQFFVAKTAPPRLTVLQETKIEEKTEKFEPESLKIPPPPL